MLTQIQITSTKACSFRVMLKTEQLFVEGGVLLTTSVIERVFNLITMTTIIQEYA